MSWLDIFGTLEDLSRDFVGVSADDYIGDDGLLYCGKCHTPKQTRVEVLGTVRMPYCMCKCKTEQIAAEAEAEESEKRQRQIERLRDDGFPEAGLRACRFETDDGENAKVTDIARRYVDNFERMKADGTGLLLYGTVGTGKTFIAACIANALIDKGIPCLVTNFARISNALTRPYADKQSVIDSLNRYDLLVIDDLAAERDTEFMNEVVYTIIDARARVQKPLIITTNLTAEELKQPAEVRKQRIFSRLFEMCLPVKVEGKDRRRGKLRSNVNTYAELLGL